MRHSIHRIKPLTGVAVLISLGCAMLSTPAPVSASNGSSMNRPKSAPAARSFSNLPLSFEANQGQTDSQVKFLSRGGGYALFLTPREVVLTLRGPQADSPAVLRMRLAGANSAPSVEGVEGLPGKSNYFIGDDPSQWRTAIPQYAKVRYRGVYPGVDLVFYGNQRRLEYDFVVAAGADPAVIEMAYEGVQGMRLTSEGDLILTLSGGEVRHHKPVVYQEVAGVRRPIDGRYVVSGSNRVAFRLARYDADRPLVIDPVLSYSTYLGGKGDDAAFGVAVDSSGNAYVTGKTDSTDFPTASPLRSSSGGRDDVFVAKLNPAGSALLYSTYLGGSSYDRGYGIAVDSSGNAYVTGETWSTNFPVTAGAFQSTGDGDGNAFVAKLNNTGSTLVYSTYLGGRGGGNVIAGKTISGPHNDLWLIIGGGTDIGAAIAVDAAGNAYVTGVTAASNFPTSSPLQGANAGGAFVPLDAFVAKVNPTGSALVYSTYLGGKGDDIGYDIAVDASGNAYVAGTTNSSDFPTTRGAFQTTFYGGICGSYPSNDVCTEAFIAKLNPSGNALAYSTFLGGKGSETANGIAADTAGNVYVTGYTNSADFPTATPIQAARNGNVIDAFVAKLNATGSSLAYSTYLGGSSYDSGAGIAVDSSGSAWVTGYTRSSNFPTTPDAFQSATGGGEADAWVANLSAAGSTLAYCTHLGGKGEDAGNGIAMDSGGSVWVAGATNSSNFPTASPLRAANAGGQEAFLAKFPGAPSIPTVTSVSAASYSGPSVAPDSIVAAYGTGFGTTIAQATQTPLPTELAGVSVKITDSAGAERLAQLFFVSPSQINFLLPAEAARGPAKLTVTSGGQVIGAGTLQVEAFAPGLFAANANGKGVAAALTLRVSADGAQTVQLVFQCGAAPGSCTATPIDLDPETDQVFLLLFGTAIRGRSALSAVSASIAGEPTEVLAAGPQGEFAGLDQVNLRLSRRLIGRGEVNVVLTVDGKSANTVTIRIGGTPPPSPPRITALTQNSGQQGQVLSNLTVLGENLAGVTAVEFSPVAGITVTNVRASASAVLVNVAIAADAATGQRSVSVVSPIGRSNTLPFTVQEKPGAPLAHTISNVTLTATRQGNALNFSGGFDFTDPDGDIIYIGAAEGSAKVRFALHLGASSTFGEICSMQMSGPFLDKRGQTSGRITFSDTATGGSAANGSFFVSVQLIDAAGRKSNSVDMNMTTWQCP